MVRKEAGITLVALVITIVVLLILATISIIFILGSNGILTQASNAIIINREAKAREEVTMAWKSADTEYWAEWSKDANKNRSNFFTAENLSKYTQGVGTVTDSKENENGSYTLKYQSNDQGIIYTFTVDKTGNIATRTSGEENEIIDSDGTEFQQNARIYFKVIYNVWDDENLDYIWYSEVYTAEEGMSWYKFLNSDYNSSGEFESNWAEDYYGKPTIKYSNLANDSNGCFLKYDDESPTTEIENPGYGENLVTAYLWEHIQSGAIYYECINT